MSRNHTRRPIITFRHRFIDFLSILCNSTRSSHERSRARERFKEERHMKVVALLSSRETIDRPLRGRHFERTLQSRQMDANENRTTEFSARGGTWVANDNSRAGSCFSLNTYWRPFIAFRDERQRVACLNRRRTCSPTVIDCARIVILRVSRIMRR